jgi:hypothetical protein
VLLAGLGNGFHDLVDGNADCDNNEWEDSTLVTSYQSGID